MIDIALAKGSKDNISAVAMKLPGAKISADGEGVQGLRAARERRLQEETEERRAAGAAKNISSTSSSTSS